MLTEEPMIIINGRELSVGQAMAVRVAIENFAGALASEGLGDDLHGRLMQQGYFERINEIRSMICGEAPGLAHSASGSRE